MNSDQRGSPSNLLRRSSGVKWPVDKQQEQTGHDARALARPLATPRLCRTRSRHRQTSARLRAPSLVPSARQPRRSASSSQRSSRASSTGPASPRGNFSTIGLKRLAALAATAPPTSLGAGQYAYTEVERPTMTSVGTSKQGGPSITEYFTGTVQTWVAADGSGRQVTTTDATPHFYTAADQAAWVAEGSPPGVIPPSQLTTVQVFGPDTASEVNGPIPLYNVTGLPTDPTTLSQLLNNENPGAQSLGHIVRGHQVPRLCLIVHDGGLHALRAGGSSARGARHRVYPGTTPSPLPGSRHCPRCRAPGDEHRPGWTEWRRARPD